MNEELGKMTVLRFRIGRSLNMKRVKFSTASKDIVQNEVIRDELPHASVSYMIDHGTGVRL